MNIEIFRDHCLKKLGVSEDMPFDDSVLVFRTGGKIFALTNLHAEEFSVNLKADPAKIIEWREAFPDIVLPGYHMSKKHWNTVYPNRGLGNNLFVEMVDTSYECVFSGLPKKFQRELLQAD